MPWGRTFGPPPPPRCRGVIVVSTTPSLQRPITQTHESGWIARLGGWSAAHLRVVIGGYLVVMGVLDAFAPQVEKKLSGAGGQDSGSQSVQARTILGQEIAGLNSTGCRWLSTSARAQWRPTRRRRPSSAGPRPCSRPITGSATSSLRSRGSRSRRTAGRPDGHPPGRRQRQHNGPGLGGGLARAQTGVCHADRARVAARSNEARCVSRESPVGHSSSA